jgi:hypothetical protein
MPASSQTAVLRPRQAPRDVTLASWPLVEGDNLAWAGMTASGLLFVIAGAVSNSLPTGGLLAALLLVAQWRLWLPARYDVNAGGVTRTVLGRSRRVAWSMIGTVERCPQGVLALRDVEPSTLERMRALYIPYGAHKTDLLASFDYYLAGRASAE